MDNMNEINKPNKMKMMFKVKKKKHILKVWGSV